MQGTPKIIIFIIIIGSGGIFLLLFRSRVIILSKVIFNLAGSGRPQIVLSLKIRTLLPHFIM